MAALPDRLFRQMLRNRGVLTIVGSALCFPFSIYLAFNPPRSLLLDNPEIKSDFLDLQSMRRDREEMAPYNAAAKIILGALLTVGGIAYGRFLIRCAESGQSEAP